ncbi:MAG: hypothetical protein LBD72_01305 [Puniceicoccales bacterium]|jgi:hypothetical protein|nr:hypothetical protein [Puniceicoccales bacterium]
MADYHSVSSYNCLKGNFGVPRKDALVCVKNNVPAATWPEIANTIVTLYSMRPTHRSKVYVHFAECENNAFPPTMLLLVIEVTQYGAYARLAASGDGQGIFEFAIYPYQIASYITLNGDTVTIIDEIGNLDPVSVEMFNREVVELRSKRKVIVSEKISIEAYAMAFNRLFRLMASEAVLSGSGNASKRATYHSVGTFFALLSSLNADIFENYLIYQIPKQQAEQLPQQAPPQSALPPPSSPLSIWYRQEDLPRKVANDLWLIQKVELNYDKCLAVVLANDVPKQFAPTIVDEFLKTNCTRHELEFFIVGFFAGCCETNR